MDEPLSAHDRALLDDLTAGYQAYIAARYAFHAHAANRIGLLRHAFRQGNGAVALEVVLTLPATEIQHLLPDLVYLSLDHGSAGRVRQIIAALPRDWVLAHIEDVAEVHLRDDDDDAYRRILELYAVLDEDLKRKLARRAAEHANEHIREAGEDFLPL